jgi:hypothetical protein
LRLALFRAYFRRFSRTGKSKKKVRRGYPTDLVGSFFALKAWFALERDSELTHAYLADEC